MLFSRYKADILRYFPENPANYISILMYELERKAPSERRKSHFRGPRFQNIRTPLQVRGLVHRSTKPLDPPLETSAKCEEDSVEMQRIRNRP
jgi:hypothetical protein